MHCDTRRSIGIVDQMIQSPFLSLGSACMDVYFDDVSGVVVIYASLCKFRWTPSCCSRSLGVKNSYNLVSFFLLLLVLA